MTPGQRRSNPVLNRLLRPTLLNRFAATSFVVFLILGLALAFLLGHEVQSIALDEARQTAYDTLHARLLDRLGPQELTAAPMTGDRYKRFDSFIRNSILSDRTIRVKVWNRRGQVLYSNDRNIVGRTFPVEGELSEALHGELASEVSALRRSENRDDQEYRQLLEVYIPIQYRPGGTVFGAFEIYQTYAPVARQITSLRHAVDASLGGGLMVLYILLFGIVRRGSNTIAEQQRRLLQSEERFRSLVQNSSDVIMVVEADGTIQYQTPSVERVFGYAPVDLDGRTMPDLAHPDDASKALAFLTEAARQPGVTGPLESRLRHRTGSWLAAEIVATNLLHDPKVEGMVLTIRDISERKQAQEALEHQALHDPLTDLPNRTLLHDRLQHAIPVALRSGEPITLLLMDVDRFKEINDTFGHHYGDLLLQQIGPRLQGVLRASDTVARLGGDEFAILLPDTDERNAIRTAERILHVLDQPFDVEGHSLDVRASIGITLYPDHGAEAGMLLRRADVAMYHAKRTESGHAVYASEHDEYSPDRLELVGALRRAIEQDQLLLHYQPKINLKTQEIDAVEALVRWQHPERGMIPPDQFIPLAEHTGLIRPLTDWVLHRALQHCRQWRDAGLDLSVAVNLSARSLHDPQLAATIAAAIETWGVPVTRVVVELTESALMTDPVRGVEALTQLHGMGVRIAIDDFGTGYSSLAYLKRLPVDEIKIDKAFVQDLAANKDDAFIVRSVADLGHSLGLEVVAEGVEDSHTLRLLTLMGCDLAQGYHLSRPLPATDLACWVRASRSSRAMRSLAPTYPL